MIIKGASAIRGLRSLNTRPGPITESSGLLKLHQLATEKENLLKKLQWIQAQNEQANKRLSEIAHTMYVVDKTVRGKAKRDQLSSPTVSSRSTIIKY